MYYAWVRRKIIQGFGMENLEERDHLEDQGIDRRNILQAIFEKQNGWVWTLLVSLGKGQVVGSCENGHEHLGSTECRELLKYLRKYSLLKKYSAPWS